MIISIKFEVDKTIHFWVLVFLLWIHYLILWPRFLIFQLCTVVTWSVLLPCWRFCSRVVEYDDFSGYHWQCISSHCACTVSCNLCVEAELTWLYNKDKSSYLSKYCIASQVMWPVNIQSKTVTYFIWNPRPHFAGSPYNFYGAMIAIKGCLQVSTVQCWS